MINHRRLPRAFFWLSLYLLAAGVIQLWAYVLMVQRGSNILLYYMSTFVYLPLFFAIFWSFSQDSRYRKRVLIWFVISLLVLAGMILPRLNEHHFLSEIVLVLNIVVVAAALHAFYQMLKFPSTLKAIRQGLFWLITALFFYHVASLAYWAMAKFLVMHDRRDLIYALGYTNSILVILFYSLSWVSIFVGLREPKEQ